MSIKFSCPFCFRRYKVKNSLAGKTKSCKQCGRDIEIPGGAAPREPRDLVLRDSVRLHLVQLRRSQQIIDPPELRIDEVADVEDALRCVLPDEILAVIASAALQEEGFDLANIIDYQQLGKEMRCPSNLLPIAQGEEGHLLLCINPLGARDRQVGITTYCDEDQSTAYASLPEWLQQITEQAQATTQPTSSDLAAFQAKLIP